MKKKSEREGVQENEESDRERKTKQEERREEECCHNQLSSMDIFYAQFYLGHVESHCPTELALGAQSQSAASAADHAMLAMILN